MMSANARRIRLGVEVGALRIIVFLAAGLWLEHRLGVGRFCRVTWIGRAAPVRLSLGSATRLPSSGGVAGALFVVVADTLARTVIAPRDYPWVRSCSNRRAAFYLLLRRG